MTDQPIGATDARKLEPWTADPHALASELRRVANTFGEGFRIVQLLRDAADQIDTITPDAPQDEAVAWMFDYRVGFRDDENDWSCDRTSTDNPLEHAGGRPEDYRSVRPLYAQPSPDTVKQGDALSSGDEPAGRKGS